MANKQESRIMKVLPRTEFGNPILRAVAKNVPLKILRTSSFKNLIRQMFYTMRRTKGVGLAAPQIGESLQLAVLQMKKHPRLPDTPPLPPTVIVNPRIVSASKEKVMEWEGCLSCRGIMGSVPRHQNIVVEYFDENGKKQRKEIKGFHARIFQHEIDHLNGVVYVDRMPDMKYLFTKNEILKLRKKQQAAEIKKK